MHYPVSCALHSTHFLHAWPKWRLVFTCSWYINIYFPILKFILSTDTPKYFCSVKICFKICKAKQILPYRCLQLQTKIPISIHVQHSRDQTYYFFFVTFTLQGLWDYPKHTCLDCFNPHKRFNIWPSWPGKWCNTVFKI